LAKDSLLDQLAVDRQGKGRFVAPMEARVTVSELIAELEADYRLRDVRSLAQIRAHLGLPAPTKAGETPKPPRTIVAAFGHWRAGEVDAKAVDNYVDRRKAEGAAPATINRETQLLGQALRLGLRRGKLAGPLPEIRRLREDNARQGFFEAGAFTSVVANLPDHLQDVARFGYVTGWRRGEILTLTWADVDRDGGVVRLRGEHSKNGQGRTLALEGDVKALIERRWAARTVKGKDGAPDRVAELVFHRAGRPIVDYRKAWLAACVTAGLAQPKLDAEGRALLDQQGRPRMAATKLVHDLRRTAARNLVRAGVPERVAMAVTGHKTRAMFDRYNIVSEEDLRSAMQRQTEYVARLPKAAVTPFPLAQHAARQR
jgi:integrase